MSGEAFRMRVELARLAVRHGVAPKPVIIPLSDPVDHAMTLTGLASTVDVDLSRQKFRGWAFTNLALHLTGYPLPRLLYKHLETEPAGTITSLAYDEHGRLRISTDVTHELARRCNAFSIGATVLEYEKRRDSAYRAGRSPYRVKVKDRQHHAFQPDDGAVSSPHTQIIGLAIELIVVECEQR